MTWLGDLLTPRVTDVQVDIHQNVRIKFLKIAYNLFGIQLISMCSLLSKLWKLCVVYRRELEQQGERAPM